MHWLRNGCLLNNFNNDSNERNINLIKSKLDNGTSYSIDVNDTSDKNHNNRSKQHGMNDQLCSGLYLSSQNINVKHNGNDKCIDNEIIENIENVNVNVNGKNTMNKKRKLDSVDEITFSNTVTPRKKRQRLL